MSSQSPAIGALAPRMECPVPSIRRDFLKLASSSAFEARRSQIVTWTIRMAQVADRFVARTRPATQAAGAHGRGLVEKTLNGLDRFCRLIPRHQEVVAAERAHLKIQETVFDRSERLRRFEDVRRSMFATGRELEAGDERWIQLNPACCWMRLGAEPVSGAGDYPTNSALFFLVGTDLRGLKMNLEGQVLINELADYQPCMIRQWSQLTTLVDESHLITLVRHLARIGLVAYD